MATHLQAPPVAPFYIDNSNNIGTPWDMWKKQLEVYITATGLEDDKQKQALLLFCAGESVHDYLQTYPMLEMLKITKLPYKFSPTTSRQRRIEHLKYTNSDKLSNWMEKALISSTLVYAS